MNPSEHRYFIVHKPRNMVSQFVSPHKVVLLGSLNFAFPEHTHAIGRLDSDSEGLLVLTTNKKITKLLFQSEKPHRRTYLVKVNGRVSDDTLARLRSGIEIEIKGGVSYRTLPCEVVSVNDPEKVFPNCSSDNRPAPHSWLLITLTEGKYHQVRKMVAAAHHRCTRLIRISIEDLELGDLPPGKIKELEEREFFKLLKLG
jgi:23S rRNA pseudouridine2457 synthase